MIDADQEKTVTIVHVKPDKYLNDNEVMVFIPPRLWLHPNLAEYIKKAVLITQEGKGNGVEM